MRKANFILGAQKATLTKYVRDMEAEKHLIVGKRMQIYGWQYYMIEVIDSNERPVIDIDSVEEIDLDTLLERNNLELI